MADTIIMLASEADQVADEVNKTKKDNELAAILSKAETEIASQIKQLANEGKYELVYQVAIGTLNDVEDVLEGRDEFVGILTLLAQQGYVVAEPEEVSNAAGVVTDIVLTIKWDFE